MVTTEQKRAIFKEITEVLNLSRQEPDEFTTREYVEYCKETGIDMTYRRAACFLAKMVKTGRMTKRQVLVNRNWPWVFRRVIENEEEDTDSA